MTEEVNRPPSEMVHLVTEAFLIFPSDDVFIPLRSFSEANTCWADCVSAAMQGLHSVVSAAGLPFALLQSAAVQRRFDRFHSAERIRSLKVDVSTPKEVKVSDDERERFAYERADKIMTNFLESKEGSDYFGNILVYDMNHRLQSQNVRIAAEELLIQTLISSWSVFESFSRSFIISWVNDDPRRAQPILASPDLKEIFGKQVVDMQTIGEHSFDLSRSMGAILFKNRR